jgi:hypothetical protein
VLVAVAERWRHAVGCAGGIRGGDCFVRALRLRMAAGLAVSECRARVIHGGGGVRRGIDWHGRASRLEKRPQASRRCRGRGGDAAGCGVRRGSGAAAGRAAVEGAGAWLCRGGG